jgi:hypothetical protein
MRVAMNLQVDARSPIPTRQLAEQLKRVIERGDVPRGTRHGGVT